MEPEEKREPVYTSLASLSKEEREQWKKFLPPKAREAIEQYEAEGAYERCPKTDWCAKFQEEKKRKEEEEQAKKKQEVETLQKRNQLLEDHARQQEERLKRTEERMEKMASLLAQLISK